PAPRMPNDRRPPQNKNAFHLQTTTILGKMLSPSAIDHNLLDPQELPKSVKRQNFNISRMSLAGLGQMINTTGSEGQVMTSPRTGLSSWDSWSRWSAGARAGKGQGIKASDLEEDLRTTINPVIFLILIIVIDMDDSACLE
ncbi:hypothetical protein FOZ63_004848, partial [Perkinsus olseni]